LLIAVVLGSLVGCDEQILHDLTEQEANKVLSRLHVGSLSAEKVLQSDGRWAIAVDENKVIPALTFLDSNRVLAARTSNLPVSSKGGIVPSREEQWFRYERSIAVSIEESLSTIRGVLEVRVHVNLPEKDPLFGTSSKESGSGSVLLVVDERYEASKKDVAHLVSGAAGIPPERISVLQSRHAELEPENLDAPKPDTISIIEEKPVVASTPSEVVTSNAIDTSEKTVVVEPYGKSFSFQWALITGGLLAVGVLGLALWLMRKKRGTRFSLPQRKNVAEVNE
jgi:type III secretory pathway lipoprotein EscJ